MSHRTYDLPTHERLAADFRALHERGNPLRLANAWDAGTAKLVAEAGAGAIATTSGAGQVIVWAAGTHRGLTQGTAQEALEDGHLSFWLDGEAGHRPPRPLPRPRPPRPRGRRGVGL